MKAILRTIVVIILVSLSIRTTNAQTTVYLPVILSDGKQVMEYPILAISNSVDTINLLDLGSGLQMDNPYWQPNIAQLKNAGTFVNPSNADNQALVSANYDNVIETIPLRIVGPEGYKTVESLRRMLQMSVNAQNYYVASFEQNQVYFAVKPKGDNFLTGYAAVYTISLPNISNPFGTPFVNDIDYNQFDTINLILQREPFFSTKLPNQFIGPYFNQVLNSDFYNWSNGLADTEPDQWDILVGDLATGTVDADTDTHFNNGYSAKITVTGSAGVADRYGIYQTLNFLNTETSQTYTFVAWIRNNGIVNGEAQIRLNNGGAGYQYLYRESTGHLFDVFYTVFDGSDLADGNILQILIQATAANTSGSFLVDSMMILDGDYSQEIEDNLIHWLSSSQVLNSFDSNREDVAHEDRINYIDMWDVPGDVLAPMSLIFQNVTSPNDIGGNTDSKLRQLVIGEKYELDQDNFADIYDVGGNTTTDGNENHLFTTLALSDNWSVIGSWSVNDRTTALANASLYRMFARIRDSSSADLEIRIKYWVSDPTRYIYLQPYSVTTKGRFISIDLTENEVINFASAVKNINISSFGYFIEARRPNGETNSFQIDYVRHVALDNYMKLDLTVPLTTYSSVNFNYNAITPYITKYTALNQWSLEGYIEGLPSYQCTTTLYNNKLILKANSFGAFTDGVLVQVDENGLSLLYDTNDADVGANFAIGPTYQGLVPYSHFDGSLFPNSSRLFLSNGVDFPGTLQTVVGAGVTYEVGQIEIFNNDLFLLGFGNAVGRVWRWDGAVIHDLGVPNGTTQASQAIVYKNQLYVASYTNGVSSYVDRWDGGANWTNIFTGGGGAAVLNPYMTVHNGKLYFTDGNEPALGSVDLYSYDGTNLELVYDTFANNAVNVPNAITSYNNSLYIIGASSGGYAGLYKSSDNGVTFNVIKYFPTGAWTNRQFLFVFQGSLYVMTDEAIYSYTEVANNVAYTQSDFKGSGNFLANNRKLNDYEYQRLLFKFSREQNDDYLDDAAMIAVGIRPQFLSLINKDDF